MKHKTLITMLTAIGVSLSGTAAWPQEPIDNKDKAKVGIIGPIDNKAKAGIIGPIDNKAKAGIIGPIDNKAKVGIIGPIDNKVKALPIPQ